MLKTKLKQFHDSIKLEQELIGILDDIYRDSRFMGLRADLKETIELAEQVIKKENANILDLKKESYSTSSTKKG